MKIVLISILDSYETTLDGLMDLTGLSRGQIKKFYARPSKLNSKIKKGKVISVPLDLINYLKVNPIYYGPEVNILAEDQNFIVLDKPSCVHMHPLTYCESDNLVSYLISKNPQLDKINERHYDRGFIYRLDYETSGVVYFAKSNEIYSAIRDNFKQVMKGKTYFAIVHGQMQEGQLSHHYLQRKGASKVEIDSRHAIDRVTLDVKPISYHAQLDVTLVQVELDEGRRHQIRAQLAHHGHAILGDDLYGKAGSAPRLMLHCHQYQFEFGGQSYQHASPMPLAFRDFLGSDKSS